MLDRIFVDPDRGATWQVSSAIHADGRFRPVLKNGAVSMWAEEELTSDVDAPSEEQLRKMWRTSQREVRYKKQRWWVRWEERPDQQTWTWFEAESGQKRVVKAQIMFPFISGSDLCRALESARSVMP